jgi:hypothetical protein
MQNKTIPVMTLPANARRENRLNNLSAKQLSYSLNLPALFESSIGIAGSQAHRPDSRPVSLREQGYSDFHNQLVYIIRNHNGIGSGGSHYDEGSIIQKTLARLGHPAQVVNPEIGFNGLRSKAGEQVVVATQPVRNNSLLEEFVVNHPLAPIAWRPGWAQLVLVKALLSKGNFRVIHLCLEKARCLTGRTSLSDSAQAINESCPETLVVVSDPAGAAACQHGQVIEVVSHRVECVCNQDGRGAAFFGGFLGEFFGSGNLPTSLASGHDFGLAAALGRWP